MSQLQDYLYKNLIQKKIIPFLTALPTFFNQVKNEKVISLSKLLLGIILWVLFILFLGWIVLSPCQNMPMGGWGCVIQFGIIIVFIHFFTNVIAICTKNKNYALITNCGTSLLILYEYIKLYSYSIYDFSKIREHITDEAYYSEFIWLLGYVLILPLQIYVIKRRSAKGSLFVLIILLLLAFLGI